MAVTDNEIFATVSKDETATKYEGEGVFQTSRSSTDTPSDEQNEEKEPKRGRIAGGAGLEDLSRESCNTEEDLPLKKVDIDMALTITNLVHHDGEDFIVLEFAPGCKENPFNWSPAYKYFITALLCLMTLFIGLATSAYSSGITSMTEDFGVSTELGQLGMFTFNFACALAPLFLAPFCELVGRRIVYIGAYALFIVVFVGLALGKNIATILVMRALSGLFGCVGTILVGGTFSDIYSPNDRAIPMSFFSYIAILGTVAAPIYAGFINETIGWRWIEGIQGLSNLPLFIVILFGLTETRGGVTLHNRARALREATGDQRYQAKMDLEARGLKEMLHNSSVKAVHMLITEPVVFAFGLWIAFAWTVTFLFLSVIPITFQEKRGWNEGLVSNPSSTPNEPI